MGKTLKGVLGLAALASVLLLGQGFIDSAWAADEQIAGLVSSVEDYVVTVDGVGYLVTATSKLNGAEHGNLAALEGQQVQITYTEIRGQKRVVELTVL